MRKRARAISSSATEGGKKLESDRLAEFEIVGAVDLAHAAAAQQFDDAVALSEDSAGKETAVDCVVVRSRSGSVCDCSWEAHPIAGERAIAVRRT